MTIPPIYNLRDLGRDVQQMAKTCNNERLAITMQCAAIGSMIIMAAATAAHTIKDLLRNPERHDRSK